MMLSTKKSVAIADVYCGEKPDRIAADVVRYNQWSSPTPGVRYSPFHTILIDITQEEAALLAQMEKGTRYEIRRAHKEELFTESLEAAGSEAVLTEFCDFYDRSAALKDLPPMDRNWLGAMARAGELALTQVNQGEAPLAWHAYHCGPRTVVLLFSMSAHRESSDAAFRQLVGRANRYLHWQDILRFKQKGVATMDMGGWYGGKEDQALLHINKFKEDFGGKVIEVYNSMAGISIKGKLAVWYIHRRTARAGEAGKQVQR